MLIVASVVLLAVAWVLMATGHVPFGHVAANAGLILVVVHGNSNLAWIVGLLLTLRIQHAYRSSEDVLQASPYYRNSSFHLVNVYVGGVAVLAFIVRVVISLVRWIF
jgi:hypothetical protein